MALCDDLSMTDPGRYERLDPVAVASTLDVLHRRIVARFPTRNIGDVALALTAPIESAAASTVSTRHERRIRALCGVAVAFIVAVVAVALFVSVRDALRSMSDTQAFEWLPIIESAINNIVFAGIAVFFIAQIPQRQQRRRTLTQLHRLRSLAHVIDMHQLAKDPERLRSSLQPTDVSLTDDLSEDELGKYLSYCGELLAIVGKAAALHAEATSDPVVLDTVSEIETLTSGISREIWQKITLLRTGDGSVPASEARSSTNR